MLVLTNRLENGARLAENKVEVTSSLQGANRRFYTVAFAADYTDFNTPHFHLLARRWGFYQEFSKSTDNEGM